MALSTDRLGETDKRPWEEPGSCRMDCEPHRGLFLLLLGTVSLVFSALSCFVVPMVVSFPLGMTTWVLARNDLRRMRMGLLDPRGQAQTERACSLGGSAAFVSVALPMLVCLGIFR